MRGGATDSLYRGCQLTRDRCGQQEQVGRVADDEPQPQEGQEWGQGPIGDVGLEKTKPGRRGGHQQQAHRKRTTHPGSDGETTSQRSQQKGSNKDGCQPQDRREQVIVLHPSQKAKDLRGNGKQGQVQDHAGQDGHTQTALKPAHELAYLPRPAAAQPTQDEQDRTARSQGAQHQGTVPAQAPGQHHGKDNGTQPRYPGAKRSNVLRFGLAGCPALWSLLDDEQEGDGSQRDGDSISRGPHLRCPGNLLSEPGGQDKGDHVEGRVGQECIEPLGSCEGQQNQRDGQGFDKGIKDRQQALHHQESASLRDGRSQQAGYQVAGQGQQQHAPAAKQIAGSPGGQDKADQKQALGGHKDRPPDLGHVESLPDLCAVHAQEGWRKIGRQHGHNAGSQDPQRSPAI